MKKRELLNLKIPDGPPIRAALDIFKEHKPDRETSHAAINKVLQSPEDMANDPVWGSLAKTLIDHPNAILRETPATLNIWGNIGTDIDQPSLDQARRACELPIAVAAALMPDAHVGYGLPIGGVLATKNAVIPYAVGVDIACRMKISVYDLDPATLQSDKGRDELTAAIEEQTRFGIGASFKQSRQHDVMDQDWSVSPITMKHKDKAYAQLGTSGSGNHFVEFGVLTVPEEPSKNELGLPPGRYLALMSHSGSRGTGAAVCDHYSKLAMQQHPDLGKHHRHLAWLDMDSQQGCEYWNAMNHMGDYASANHACIHHHIAKHLGVQSIATVENHHNFAWQEQHTIDGQTQTVIVHRKGATPAGEGVLGVIPGSMADPAFIVAGRDGQGSLSSASHGAGRCMSRTAAKNTYRWPQVRQLLEQRGVTVISAGIDEAPGVYKDINTVMQLQKDLVRTVARFDPKLVKMAPEGERAED